MHLCYDEAKAVKLKGSIRIQVHDDLVIACPRKEVYQWVNITEKAVSLAASQLGLKVPLPVEHKMGRTWGSLHPITTQ